MQPKAYKLVKTLLCCAVSLISHLALAGPNSKIKPEPPLSAEMADSREYQGMRWKVECRPGAFEGQGLKARMLMLDFAEQVLKEGLARLERINGSAACQMREELKKKPFIFKCEGRLGKKTVAITAPRILGRMGLAKFHSNILAPTVVKTLLAGSGIEKPSSDEIRAAKNTLFHEILHAAGVENKTLRAHRRVYKSKTMDQDVTFSCANFIFPDPKVEACIKKIDGTPCFFKSAMCATCAEFEPKVTSCRNQMIYVSINGAPVGCSDQEADPTMTPAGWPSSKTSATVPDAVNPNRGPANPTVDAVVVPEL